MTKQQIYTVATAGFEAACKIDSLPDTHRASQLHGHGFQVKIRADLSSDWASFEGAEVDQLQTLVQTIVAPLDHHYLNDIISNPTNENIARWVQNNLPFDADKVAVQSTPTEGVDIDHSGIAHVWQQFTFEAAHQLPNVEAGHQCGRMHGHGFKVILHADQLIGSAEMATDLDELADLWQSVAPELEYACLNDIEGLENPTSEHLSAWLWRRLKPQLAALSFVSVYETNTAGCHFDGKNYRIWKDFSFESALKLSHAPIGDKRRLLHGHSYLMRLHLQAPLDKVLGWTVDYGDVRSRFNPVLQDLDHHTLNALATDSTLLRSPSCANISKWVRSQIDAVLPELDRIDCYERYGCGAVLSWAEQGPALPI